MKKSILLFTIFICICKPIFNQILYENTLKFGQVLEWVDKYYVDTVNKEQLVEISIIEMLNHLDPHSNYLTREEVKEMNEPLEGNFEGIGIQFNILHDTIFVVQAIPGGPSEKVGITAGDRIIKVDGEDVAGKGITNNDVFRLLRGDKGTKVTVTVLRRNLDDLLDFTITRDKIPLYSVDAVYMINNETGYIKINRFSLTTVQEFEDAIEKLKTKNLQNLIIDLSGNGGGYLDIAIKLADHFLSKDKVIVYTEGVNSPKKEYTSTTYGNFETGKVAVLIDEGSASASEILAGAIQDWDRGIIIGRRSFGKGLVQRPLLLHDQSMIRLTIARYYTPTGRLIQKPYGVNNNDYNLDIVNRYNNGEMMNKDSIHFSDSLAYKTLLNKRTVYGGGGIMPDIFVAMDTSYYSDYYRDIIRKGILNQFVLTYIDTYRDALEKVYPNFETYEKSFEVSDSLIHSLVEYAKNEGLEENTEQIELSKNQFKLLIKAYVARDIWDTTEFYRIINKTEPKIKKALDIFENAGKYQVMLRAK